MIIDSSVPQGLDKLPQRFMGLLFEHWPVGRHGSGGQGRSAQKVVCPLPRHDESSRRFVCRTFARGQDAKVFHHLRNRRVIIEKRSFLILVRFSFLFFSLFVGFSPLLFRFFFFLQILQEWKLVAPMSPTKESLTGPFMDWRKRSKRLKAFNFNYITR